MFGEQTTNHRMNQYMTEKGSDTVLSKFRLCQLPAPLSPIMNLTVLLMVSRCYLGTSRSVIQHLIMKSRKSKFPLISVRGKGRFLSISLAGSHVRHLLNLPASWEHLFALAARKQLLLFDPPGVSIPGFCRRHLGYLILTRSHCLYSFHFFISLCYVYLHKKPHIL